MEERKGGMERGKGGALWLDRVSQTSLHPLQSSSRLGQDPFGDWGAEESLTDPLSLSFSLGQWGRKSCDLRGCLRALKAGSRPDETGLKLHCQRHPRSWMTYGGGGPLSGRPAPGDHSRLHPHRKPCLTTPQAQWPGRSGEGR